MLDGLKTFPMPTGQTDSEKMIEAEFGIKGYAVLMKLYQAIYSRGYYMKWDIDTKLLFIRDYYLTEIGGNLVSEIVAACVRRGVFDSALYEQYEILTSSRIEETFLNAKQRSAKVIMDKNYALPIVYTFIDNANKKGKDVNIFFKNADKSSTFSAIGKERKGKEKISSNEDIEVSKKESNKEKKNQSYDELFEEMGVKPIVKEALIEFIRHLQANGTILINSRLEDIIVGLDMRFMTDESAKVKYIKDAISKGYKRLTFEGEE